MRTRRQTILSCGTLIVLVSGASIVSPQTGISQGLYNQTNLYSSADIHVDGEVSNTGKFENKGMITVTGDWESSGHYNGDGEVHAMGNAPQKISHHNQSIAKFVVDGWGTKYIKGSLRIDAGLVLKQGVVEVSPEDALRLADKAIVSGGSADTYIDGALIVTGRGYKFFPVGKNGTYAPIEFLDVKGNRAEFSIEAFENVPLTSVENVLVRNALYWERRDVSGHFEGSRVAVAYDRNHFDQPGSIILLTGTTWQEPFDVINELEHSAEDDKVSTLSPVLSPFILLGETSNKWRDADFYLSTALSPHAARPENRAVKVFGERLVADQFHFQVFDRWGTLVYENVSLEKMAGNGWDGRTSAGRVLAGGTYPFRLTALDKAGRKFEKKGVITIVY